MHSIFLRKVISNARRYWPMHIVEGGDVTKFRIGGMPPAGIEPKRITERTRYFGTFPISGSRDVELSIFCSFDYVNTESPLFITRNIHKPIDETCEVIECAFHERSPRGKGTRLVSELNGYGVSVGPESLDETEDKKGGVPHKIGRIPFVYPKFKTITDSFLNAGYFHLLQWAFPGKGDCAVKGEWPFADYLFHFFLKESKDGYGYRILLV